LLRAALDDGHGRAVWVDADVLVFDPAVVSLDVTAGFGAVGEAWVTAGRTLSLVCNAVLSVTDGAWLDDVLAETERRHAEGLHDRALGPDLFTALHRSRPFDLLDGWGVLSPIVVADVAAGGGAACDAQARAQPVLGAVNLCASMADDDAVWDRAVGQLTSSGSWPLARNASLHASHTGSFFGSRVGTNTAPQSASNGVPRT
jgi:hypothetical protein